MANTWVHINENWIYFIDHVEAIVRQRAWSTLLPINGMLSHGMKLLTLWGRDKMDAITQTTLSSAFFWIPTKISLKFVPKSPINSIPALVQIMAWRRPGDKPLSELMMVSLLTHICVARPQWVNINNVDLASKRFCAIHMRAYQYEMQSLNYFWKLRPLNIESHFLGINVYI